MNRSETNSAEWVFIAVTILFLGMIIWLTKTFDVPWQIALETSPALIIWIFAVIGGVFACIKMGVGGVIWGAPLAISLLIPVFKPILRYAAGVQDIGGLLLDDRVSWYGTDWGMSLIFFGILIVGYGLLYWWQRQYSY